MKSSDYRRLAKISIKARKKSTRNTVTGICFGLIMLIPVIFFAMAFYVGITTEVNKIHTISTFEVTTRNYYDDGKMAVANNYNDFSIIDNKSINSIVSDENCAENIAFENYIIRGIKKSNNTDAEMEESVTLRVHEENGAFSDYLQKKSQSNNNNNGNYGQTYYNRLKVAHVDKDNFKYILDSELYDLKKLNINSIFSQGEGFTKDTLGKTEVLLSERFVKQFLPDDVSVVGKKISLNSTIINRGILDSYIEYVVVNGSGGSNDGNNNNNRTQLSIKIMQEFTVKGLISDKYYSLSSTQKECDVWVTSASMYLNDEYSRYAPRVNFYRQENEDNNRAVQKYTYQYAPNIAGLEESAKENGVMLQALGALEFSTDSGGYSQVNMTNENSLTIAPLKHKIQAKDFNSAKKLEKKIQPVVMAANAQLSATESVSRFSNQTYTQISMVNMIGGYAMLVLFAFGGIIFFATMLNLYNSVNYSVQSRKNYMGVMRAIGAKQKMIPKLYFFEILLIFLRSLPWVLIISGGMSFGIKMGVDALFKYLGVMMGVVIKLQFWFYFLTLAIVVGIVFLIALSFSQIACKYAATRPILDVLSDDKG